MTDLLGTVNATTAAGLNAGLASVTANLTGAAPGLAAVSAARGIADSAAAGLVSKAAGALNASSALQGLGQVTRAGAGAIDAAQGIASAATNLRASFSAGLGSLGQTLGGSLNSAAGRALGSLMPGSQTGVESVVVRPNRSIGPFQAQVTVEESHSDELVITDHPVETGATISDHAFMRPSELVIQCGWSNSPSDSSGGGLGELFGAISPELAASGSSFLSGNSVGQVQEVYQNLLELQRARVPFEVQTGKRIYRNMLIQSLRTTTNKETENSLLVTAVLREVLIVSTQVVTVGAPKEAQEDPGSTEAPVDKGTVQPAEAPTADKADARESLDPIANAHQEVAGPPEPTPPQPATGASLGTGIVPPGFSKDPQTGLLINNDTGIPSRAETDKYQGRQF